MKVYVIQEGYECDIRIFSTRDKAALYLSPGLERLWQRMLDPNDDLDGAMGGRKWRAAHYATVRYEDWREKQFVLSIEEVAVDTA